MPKIALSQTACFVNLMTFKHIRNVQIFRLTLRNKVCVTFYGFCRRCVHFVAVEINLLETIENQTWKSCHMNCHVNSVSAEKTGPTNVSPKFHVKYSWYKIFEPVKYCFSGVFGLHTPCPLQANAINLVSIGSQIYQCWPDVMLGDFHTISMLALNTYIKHVVCQWIWTERNAKLCLIVLYDAWKSG